MKLTPGLRKIVLNMGALPPPTGTDPHFVRIWEDMRLLHFVVSLCMILMGLFIAARFYTKLRVTRKFEAADCMYEFPESWMHN